MQNDLKMPLRRKTLILTALIVAFISAVGILLFAKATSDIIRSEYGTYCTDLANTVAHSVDIADLREVRNEVLDIYRNTPSAEIMTADQEGEDGYAAYLSRYSDISTGNEFRALRRTLRKLQNVSHVECIYLTYPDIESEKLIYLVDGAYEDIWQTGTLEDLYASDFKVEGDISSGFGILRDKDDNGMTIINTSVPVYDSYGQIVAYAGLDYSIDELLVQQRRFVVIVFFIMLVLALISAGIAMRLVNRNLVIPVNTLSEAAAQYYRDSGIHDTEMHRFADIDIHTGDEIETLARSMARMESDMNDHIRELLSTKNELSDAKEYAMKMEEDAFKDPLTGVRNKRSYEAATANLTSDIDQGVARFGIAVIDINDLKMINDSFGHNHGDDAIRKISGIICEVFRHSPVYRYGGDEFIVLLRNMDLANIEQLTAEFRKQNEISKKAASSENWERVDAAIGYSVFDPDADTDTSDVFERADRAMYEDKMRIKQSSGQ